MATEKDLMLFTVSYNHLHKLPRLLYSIDRFVSGHASHLIWDNASTDGTREWLTDLQRPNTIILSSDVNINDLPAYNEMAKMCQAPYFLAINPNTRVIGHVDIPSILRLFEEDPNLVLVGNMGPRVLFSEIAPTGVGGWGWVPRLLEERDWVTPSDVDTAHVQTWCFFANTQNFLSVGGFHFRNRLFDMRWPNERFEEQSLDFISKGNMIASEVELSVRARRLGYSIAAPSFFPFYHYFSYEGHPNIGEMDEADARLGFRPLGYSFGMMGEDRYVKELE